ncbi:NAD(P)H-hydrate dehydratase [Candidatus Woesearchaeota archaeon]|nr:NAD(P)H-hydrate dehydratase [Candidatus Woesearchaeota archaeon]
MNIKPPKIGGHKGENGRVLVVGGSMDYSGAVFLAAMAALRIGADYVATACPKKVGWAINALSPDIITKKIDCEYFSKEDVREVLEYSKSFDVVLVGNGLSDKKESLEFAKEIVKNVNNPIVIDADALKTVDLGSVRNAVFTPHKKEYDILTRKSNDIGENVIIKKGPVDMIITKNKKIENKTGCDRMAVAGTGDVLAGLVAGLLAKGYGLFEAAKKAAFINGKLGEKARKDFGDHFVASDLLEYIRK